MLDAGQGFLNSLFFKFSLRTLRLCGEKHVFNLGILGNYIVCGLVLTIRVYTQGGK